MPKRNDGCICSDGLRGRSSGEWARTKLQFLEEYIPPALAVTHAFRRRWYLDLFAGPGRNVDRHRGGEFDGSPLRALGLLGTDKAGTTFTDAVFINRNEEDHKALRIRVDRALAEGRSRIPSSRITVLHADTNEVLPEIMSKIGTRDYVVVFADITGPAHWPFYSVRELRRQGHNSVDLYALFPLEMALVRKLSFIDRMTERYAADLTAFFGGEEWRAIRAKRKTSTDSPRLKAELVELYESKLRTLWKYAATQERIGKSERQRLYSMHFATDHPIAQKLAKWQRSHDQGSLFD